MILFDMDANNIFQNVNKIILLIMLLQGIYLASVIRLDFTFYTILDIDFMKNYFGGWLLFFYHIIGAFLLFFALSRLSFSIKVFSSKVAVYIGKISFSIYILHFIVICSLSSYIFLWLKNYINASNELSFIVTSAMTIVVTILLSHIFHYYIELKSINWPQSLYNLVSRQKWTAPPRKADFKLEFWHNLTHIMARLHYNIWISNLRWSFKCEPSCDYRRVTVHW